MCNIYGFSHLKEQVHYFEFNISVSIFLFFISVYQYSYLYNVFLQSELEKRHAEEIRKHQMKENQLKEALKDSTSEKVTPKSIFLSVIVVFD